MRYLRRTLEFGLVYDGLKIEECSLAGYVDSDFREDIDKRRSKTGYLFTLGS